MTLHTPRRSSAPGPRVVKFVALAFFGAAALALLLAVAVLAGDRVGHASSSDGAVAPASSPGERAPRTLRLMAGRRPLLIVPFARADRLSPARLVSMIDRLPSKRRVRVHLARFILALDKRALSTAVARALTQRRGVVYARERVVAASVRLPIVQQALRNNCETAALSMLLAGQGVRVPQLQLQDELARSGPLDPIPAPGGLPIWGDPNTGFVGRPEGGGTSGGYGVYENPIRALALRHGVGLKKLSKSSASAIYAHLLTGSPVMVWVGLSDGPHKTWRTRSGRLVRGNFGEHTVVLTGIRGKVLEVNDPLTGERATWTRAGFETLWGRLGKRALAA